MRVAFAALGEMASGPSWPIVALSAAAWALVIGLDNSLLIPALCASHAGADWSNLNILLVAASINGSTATIFYWLVMLCAMMTPLLWQPLTHVWECSLTERRVRAICLFISGYLGVWTAAMAALTLLAIELRLATGSPVAFLIALAFAALWQITPAKARFLRRCHVLKPLPAFGFGADLASFRFGTQIARPCIMACWAIMLLPLATDVGHTAMMGLAALIMLSERYSAPSDLGVRLARHFRENIGPAALRGRF